MHCRYIALRSIYGHLYNLTHTVQIKAELANALYILLRMFSTYNVYFIDYLFVFSKFALIHVDSSLAFL